MDRARVVVLSSHSLFTEGVASRLKQHVDRVDLQHVDVQRADALELIVASRPAVIIVDAGQDLGDHCSLGKILQALPTVKVIRLDPQQERVQLVTSEQHPAGEVSDLIELIEA